MYHEVALTKRETGIPIHWGGHSINNAMTVTEIMDATGTNWEVFKSPVYTRVNDVEVEIGDRNVLVRSSDNEVFDIVGGSSWFSTQNRDAITFFKEYIEKGNMEMVTGGSLKGGQIVWILARINSAFDLFGGDRVQGYVLFTNYHMYGQSRDIRVIPIRDADLSTLTAVMTGNRSDKLFRATHKTQITHDMIAKTFGAAQKTMDDYRQLAEYLGSKYYTIDSLLEFFREAFPSNSVKGEAARNAMKAQTKITEIPTYAVGTWWQAICTIMHMTDFVIGNNDILRAYNFIYGPSRELKVKAFKLVKEYADKS